MIEDLPKRAEFAGCALRALALPQNRRQANARTGVPGLRSTETDTHEEATAGILDTIALDEDRVPQVVIDWKSDVDPTPETLDHYSAQVRAYREVTGAERRFVILLTRGIAIPVRH